MKGGSVGAQTAAVQRTTLQTEEFPAALHTITVRIEFPKGAVVAPHTHPGVEMGYVVSGQAQVTIAGAAPMNLKEGDSFKVSPDTVHSVANATAPSRTAGPRRLATVRLPSGQADPGPSPRFAGRRARRIGRRPIASSN